MQKMTIAIPSDTNDGLESKRSAHFGHCPLFTLVDINGDTVTDVWSVANVSHGAGGCMQPVAMLAAQGVRALVVGGMGRGPYQKLRQHDMDVYFADPERFPDVKSAIEAFLSGKLLEFGQGQLCTGNGHCHQHGGRAQIPA